MMITLEKKYSYEEILQSMKSIAQRYQDFVVCRIIGESHDERTIPMLVIGTGPQVLICSAGLHGRESANPTLLLRVAEEYCEAYEQGTSINDNYDVRSLLTKYSICIIPLLNPDGYEIALKGFSAIHNPILRQTSRMKRISPESWKYNARGVDINRNFPSKTYIQQQPCEYPASENETQALMRVFHDYESIAYVDFHSRGKIIYYYRQAMPYRYNQKSHRLAKHLQKISHYSLGKKEEEMLSKLSGGNSVHYYSETMQKPALTVETIEDNASFPLNTSYHCETFEEIHTIPLEIMKVL